MLDGSVERVFLAKEGKRIVVAAGAPEIVKRAQVAAGRERALAVRGQDHARDRGIDFPRRELLRERAHHAGSHRIERVRAIERDEAGCAAALEQNFRWIGLRRSCQLPNKSLLMISRITSLVPSRI